MAEQTITCPQCGHKFALDAAFKEHFESEKRRAVNDAIKSANKKAEEERKLLKEELAEERKQLQEELAAEREKIEKKYQEQAEEAAEKKYRLEIAAKDEEMRRIQKQLEDLERRTRQGSMELQGEALETLLKSALQDSFPLDNIEDVKKGQAGADLIHTIINPRGQRCGTIVWETKNTKAWNNDWLNKIKSDGSNVNAHVMVIVSVTLPEGVSTFDLIEGVWVCSVDAALALAKVLRQNLIQASDLQRAMEGMGDKMEAVYIYLTSPKFRDRIQRIVDTWQMLQGQVVTEKRAMEKQWKERTKQLDIMIDVTTEMYTDISAVIGAEMQQVKGLGVNALPNGADEADGDE
jgi:hypothetical protein